MYTWATFKAAVKGLMSDASRNNTTVALAVASYVKHHIALNVDKNSALAQAHMTNWITQRKRLLGFETTLSSNDLRTEVDKLLTVDSNRRGIEDYIPVLITNALNELAGAADFIDATIRQGVIEMQHFIEFYRNNHETRYGPTDVTEEGEASLGEMPEEARIWDAYYVRDDEPCVRMSVAQYDWQNRFDLTCGSPKMMGSALCMAIEPNARTFLLFPPVLTDHYLSIYWDGTKLNFEDDDSVPFDEGFAEAVANYVLYKLYLQPDSLNAKLAAVHEELYKAKRLQLFRDSKERTVIRYQNDSPSPKTGGCGSGCAVDDVVGTFGEGGTGVIPEEETNDEALITGWYRCPTLADLRAIHTKEINIRRFALLLGETAAYDGNLQGIYDYVPEGQHTAREDDNANWIIVDDGRSAWHKHN